MTQATLDREGAALSEASADLETDVGPPRAGEGVERRCIVRQDRFPRDEMIRFVLSPEGEVTPDVACRLPGRGAWVCASSSAVDLAQSKGIFSRAFRQTVRTPPGLSATVGELLSKRALDFLGMSKKAGELVIGFEQVREAIRSERPACLIEASDGSADGRGKLLALLRAVHGGDRDDSVRRLPELVGCFSGAELGMALGRERVIHACLREGRLSRVWMRELGRVAGFRPLWPVDWLRAGHSSDDHRPETEDGTAS
ncbi:MAG: RNA-binding protein [Alphaproteobacteria bacterium]|nr:RNA-binding protein [Alphaproteobacteria bacterium]